MKKQKDFYKVNDVKEILSVSANTAYKIIRELNKELKDKNFFVQQGRVNAKYFKERYKLIDMQ
jgi:gp27 protein